MICQRIRRSSISKGCDVSISLAGNPSSSGMEVKTIERVDRPEWLDSLSYLRQQNSYQGESRHNPKAFSAVLS